MSLRSPLGRALGKGAAGAGVGHWWLQRVTAVALVPLGLWFVVALAARDLRDYETMRAWVGTGWTPVLLMLLVVALTQHSWLGVQVVVEDYVQGKGARTLALLVSTFAHGVVAAAALFAVLKVAVLKAAVP